MPRIKCIISYDGSGYMGFQVQDQLPTIELMLMNAINRVTNEEVKVYASGRTDRGVHAIGQVIHFDTNKEIKEYGWKKAINSFLPDDIRVVSVSIVDESFHSRFSAKSKEYHYIVSTNDYDIFNRNYMVFYKNLNIKAMKKALKMLEGTHNFKGFCSGDVDSRKDFVKTIYKARLKEKNGILTFSFEGSGFLKYQIRRMMGLVLDIGLGRDTLDKIAVVFDTKDPKVSHKNADPQGLYLYKVSY